MTKLKTNWAIRTTDEQLKAYIGTLEALGYAICKGTIEATEEGGMENFTSLVDSTGGVCRGWEYHRENTFPDILPCLPLHP